MSDYGDIYLARPLLVALHALVGIDFLKAVGLPCLHWVPSWLEYGFALQVCFNPTFVDKYHAHQGRDILGMSLASQ